MEVGGLAVGQVSDLSSWGLTRTSALKWQVKDLPYLGQHPKRSYFRL